MLTPKNVFDVYDIVKDLSLEIKDLRLEIKSGLNTSNTDIGNKIDSICEKINIIQQDKSLGEFISKKI